MIDNNCLFLKNAHQVKNNWLTNNQHHLIEITYYNLTAHTYAIKLNDEPSYSSCCYKKWFENNVLHRVNGPAVIDNDYRKSMRYYQNGQPYRDFGPNVIDLCNRYVGYHSGWDYVKMNIQGEELKLYRMLYDKIVGV